MYATLYVDGEAQSIEDEYERVSVDVDDERMRPKFRCARRREDLPDVDEPGAVAGSECLDRELADDGSYPPHEAEGSPLSWVNHAAITLSEEEDSVTVSISVGDPRGAFAFTIRRMPDREEAVYPGRLLMHLPYPGEPMPHEDLEHIQHGTYLIG